MPTTMPNNNFHFGINYATTHENGDTHFYGGQTCFAKISSYGANELISSSPLASVAVYPNVLGLKHAGQIIETSECFTSSKHALWIEFLQSLWGKKHLTPYSSAYFGCEINVRGLSLGETKALLFLYRMLFIDPVLGVFFSKFQQATSGDKKKYSTTQLWNLVPFLCLHPLKKELNLLYDHSHSIFCCTGGKKFLSFEKFRKHLQGSNQVSNNLWSGTYNSEEEEVNLLAKFFTPDALKIPSTKRFEALEAQFKEFEAKFCET